MSRVKRVSKPVLNENFHHEMAKVKKKNDSPPPEAFARYCFSLHLPVSMTYLMPGIVIEVSAMLVARIHFRIPEGAGKNAFEF